MNTSTVRARLTGAALAAMFALPFLAADAIAAKEKFQRSKPHVNVGTIGHVEEPDNLANPGGSGTTAPADDRLDSQNCTPDPSKPTDAQTC